MSADGSHEPNEAEVAARISELTRSLIAALDAEQQRFAQLLHDTSSQSLNAARIYARIARTTLDQTSSSAATTLTALEEAVENAANETQHVLHWLRPARLERCGLFESLMALTELTSRSVPCLFHCEKVADVDATDAEVQQEVLRIAQLALHALVRSGGVGAGSPPLRVELDLDDREIVLKIRASEGRALPSELTALLEARARIQSGSLMFEHSGPGSTWICRLPKGP